MARQHLTDKINLHYQINYCGIPCTGNRRYIDEVCNWKKIYFSIMYFTRNAEASSVLSKKSNPVSGLISAWRRRPIHLDPAGVRPEAEEVCLDDGVYSEEHVKVAECLSHSGATFF